MKYKNINKTKQVVKEMLEQRGYKILNDTSLIKEKLEYLEKDDYFFALKQDDTLIFVFFTDIEKFNSEYVKYYDDKLKCLEINHCIILYNNNITSSAKKQLLNIPVISTEIKETDKIKNKKIEMFRYDELSFNITKHELQPLKFETIPIEEEKNFKKKYGTKIPKLCSTDPIVKFYNFDIGKIIKITRKSGYVIHRIVKKSLKK